MELRHLRYFCAVAEQRSFTAAARQLNVSQSGVSGQVGDLETEIGVSLLRRSKGDVALTAEGQVFYGEARAILARAERAVSLAVQAARGQTGRLTVGLCGPVTATFLPRMIRAFRRQNPEVALAIRDYAPSEQIEALLSGAIDIGFARSIPPEARHMLGFELLFREPVIVATPKGHALAQAETVAVQELAAEPLILFSRDGAPEIFDAIVTMCRRAKFSPRIADTPRSWQSVLTLVESQEGLALVPECVRHLRANEIVFRPLRGGKCMLDVLVAWRRREASPSRESFLELIRSEGAHRGPARQAKAKNPA